jgi:hypothetical protein
MKHYSETREYKVIRYKNLANYEIEHILNEYAKEGYKLVNVTDNDLILVRIKKEFFNVGPY